MTGVWEMESRRHFLLKVMKFAGAMPKGFPCASASRPSLGPSWKGGMGR